MEQQKKKCSLLDHKEANANSFCLECKIYLCNKCECYHSKLFPNHQTYNSEIDLNEIFTGFCKEKEHHEKLEFFCKTHNKLCCATCIAKIKTKEIGMHKDCDVCLLDDIKNQKKNKIEENIKYLKELSSTLQESINQLNTVFEKINEKKEKIKIKIQSIFTKLRNELNNREDQLLLETDEIFNKVYFNEKIIKEGVKLPEKIKLLLEKVENINKDYNSKNLSLFINNCINVENNIKNIIEINENIQKCNNSINKNICFHPKGEEEINQLSGIIKAFGKISLDDFEEINNPWSLERFNYMNVFHYTLKENDYIAEKTAENKTIHLIKSLYKFKKDKIYKLEFITNYLTGDFDIGFADFENSTSYARLKSCSKFEALTNLGLYIDGKKANENIKIENGKNYQFIIDIAKKNFILNIDENKIGEYNFDFQDNIFAHASMRNIGNSVKIKTYEK